MIFFRLMLKAIPSLAYFMACPNSLLSIDLEHAHEL
jgi:hypothetical protein